MSLCCPGLWQTLSPVFYTSPGTSLINQPSRLALPLYHKVLLRLPIGLMSTYRMVLLDLSLSPSLLRFSHEYHLIHLLSWCNSGPSDSDGHLICTGNMIGNEICGECPGLRLGGLSRVLVKFLVHFRDSTPVRARLKQQRSIINMRAFMEILSIRLPLVREAVERPWTM